jgi:polysaccharide pyruvyl transferase WcaK-like protein
MICLKIESAISWTSSRRAVAPLAPPAAAPQSSQRVSSVTGRAGQVVSSIADVRITVLGNFSGRNTGDAAILEGVLRDVTRTFPERRLAFRIPTINPGFVRRAYAGYPVQPVSQLPTHLSLKVLGLPTTRAVLGADLVLVTDAILFDRRLYNPLFNYLHTMSWLLPWAARRGVPVVLYNMSLGPIHSPAGLACLGRVLRSARKIILRDRLSFELASRAAPDLPPPLAGADSALSALPAPAARVDALIRDHGVGGSGSPVLGFNVSAYVDTYANDGRRRISDAEFQTTVAGVLDRAVAELQVDVLLVVTQPMDRPMTEAVARCMRHRDRVRMLGNPPLSHGEIAGLLGRVDAFIGMRTHSLILASGMHTPLGGIIAYPKNRGYLESIGRSDGMLEFADFTPATLWNLVRATWEQRTMLRERLAPAVERERVRARSAAAELGDWLGS